MANTNRPDTSPAAPEPASNDNGSEAADLAAAAVAMDEEGLFDDDAAGLERARRQRDPEAYQKAQAEARDVVTVRVTEEGDGKISRGRHYAGVGEDHFERGETFKIPRVNAVALRKRHFVEILG